MTTKTRFFPACPMPLVAVLTGFLAIQTGHAQYTCVTNNGSITITSYTNTDVYLTIPGSINGLPVTGIGDSAFEGPTFNPPIAITFPGSVTTIGQFAFGYRYNLMSVTFSNGLISIGSEAFRDDDSLGNVVLPSSVASIGTEAFDNCHLTSIIIPSNVTYIGTSPFRACYWLTNITVDPNNPSYTNDAYGVVFDKAMTTLIQFPFGGPGTYQIPNGVTTVASAAFADSYGLTNVSVPASVTSLASNAFSACSGLGSIYFSGDAPSVNNSTLYGVGTAQVYPPVGALPGTGGWNSTFAGLPVVFRYMTNSVLFYYTFTNGAITIVQCSSSTVLNIPAAIGGWPVTALKGPAMKGLFGGGVNFELGFVTIPSSVTDIEWAFYYCFNLYQVTIPNSVTNLGPGAFYHSDLGSVTIPDSVVSIGDYAFYNCYDALTTVNIGHGVRSIGNYAFWGCTRLCNVSIPANVTGIGLAAFSTYGMTNIAVDTQNPNYASASGVLFNKALSGLVEFPAGRPGTYAIPGGVTIIGDHAFDTCQYLTSVTVPASVTSIGQEAFYGCFGLTNLCCAGNAPSADTTSFYAYYLSPNPPQYIPATIYYLPGTTGWGTNFFGLPTAPWYMPYPQILNAAAIADPQNDPFCFTVSWATNAAVVVDACTNLAQPNWTPMQTNTLVNGTNEFSDTNWMHFPTRFYRVRQP